MTKTNSASDTFLLRLPEGLRDRMRDLAELNQRSMNAEIIHRLELSLSQGGDDLVALLSKALSLASVEATER